METVRFEVADRVATITLNRPERKNAMNQQMKDELRACWQRVKAEPDVWAAIVTGAGEAFSSGADVESLATGGFARTDRWHELAMIEGIRELPTPRRQLVHKPVIAAVNGVVAGFSLDLVTEADIPIASDKATFVDPHVSLGYVSSHEMVNMARRVPVAVWGTKMGSLQGLGLPIPQAEEIAAGYLEVVEQSEDHAEGPRAFVAKRAPRWKAR